MVGEDQFIDAETPYSKEQNTFEEILNRQIRKTADVLSQELDVGFYVDNVTKKTIKEDKRILAINHVRTTFSLIKPFLKEKFKKELKEIDKEIKKFKKELGLEKINIYGKGTFLVSEIMHDKKSIPYGKLIVFQVEKARETFEILIMAYHKNKQEIRSFSQE